MAERSAFDQSPAANPYTSPPEAPEPSPIGGVDQGDSWKQIAVRWERWRLAYNALLAIQGGAWLAWSADRLSGSVWVGVLGMALGANICFTFGPLAEMYLNWAVDVDQRRRVLPPALCNAIRSPLLTTVLFVLGLLFSSVVVLACGLALAWA